MWWKYKDSLGHGVATKLQSIYRLLATFITILLLRSRKQKRLMTSFSRVNTSDYYLTAMMQCHRDLASRSNTLYFSHHPTNKKVFNEIFSLKMSLTFLYFNTDCDSTWAPFSVTFISPRVLSAKIKPKERSNVSFETLA